ncbi:hypothetical protein OIDMADRAFT_56913 [Oidiodendron maius Zn]|uniref:Protein kinase domain-containing protein n=1 Tax=Oidiodendron maius (strain Zn) TaxID=913774 RepID=A0A0C3H5E0_OIDMZ|nr:hypothetical protein OIDMADRAFT_56913 [Oidiodendron maius Zn]
MDAFATAVTAVGLIIRLLDAYSSYSEEAKSLKIRFAWDFQTLQDFNAYIVQRRAVQANQQVDDQYAALLEQTAAYLNMFARKIQKELHKLERKGSLRDYLNRLEWATRRDYLKEVSRDMSQWATSLEVRLLSLKQELKEIPASSTGDQVRPPALVTSHSRLEELFALPSNAKQTRVKKMLLEDSSDLASEISGRDISTQPVQYKGDELIFASRRVPPGKIQGTSEFLNMQYQMGELAAALNCLDPAADIRLLKVEYYFYHAESNQFLFVQKSPYPLESMMTLEQVISATPFESTLDDRLKLANKIAEAVFFLHTAGFFHKNITSSSVVALRRFRRPPHKPTEEEVPEFDDAYLMGFDLIRGTDAITTKEGAVRDSEEPISPWDFDIFQHPDRLQGESSLEYNRAYDIYSLGVVLLEVGFWEPLRKIATDLEQTDQSGWVRKLLEIVPKLRLDVRIGKKYQRLVTWCLNLKGGHIEDAEFIEEVLNPLEEIIHGLD